MNEDTTKLNTSKLGTKEYWDDFYAVEKNNFEENPNDTGECWFSDSNAEEKMALFLMDNLGEYKINQQSTMVDVGTGNGHLLFTLQEEGFQGHMVGIDYSENSVEFAKTIAEEENAENIEFEVVDIFDKSWNPNTVDVVLDKGTLDAIALSGMKFGDKTAAEVYSSCVEKLMVKDSVLLITSCNFTEKELESLIVNDSLKLWKKVEYPSFEFGGVKGSTICTLAFIKL